MKDLLGERNMLSEYADHALLTGEDSSTDDARRAFYQTLRQDLLEDYDSVHKESIDLWYAAAELSRYEHANLDNDSKTTKLSAALAKGANIFHTFGDSVRQKYGHLVPDDFVEHPLATFKWRWLDLHGSVWNLVELLEQGHDFEGYWGDREIREKYGHLRQYYRPAGVDHLSPPTLPAHQIRPGRSKTEEGMPPLWEIIYSLLTPNTNASSVKSETLGEDDGPSLQRRASICMVKSLHSLALAQSTSHFYD